MLSGWCRGSPGGTRAAQVHQSLMQHSGLHSQPATANFLAWFGRGARGTERGLSQLGQTDVLALLSATPLSCTWPLHVPVTNIWQHRWCVCKRCQRLDRKHTEQQQEIEISPNPTPQPGWGQATAPPGFALAKGEIKARGR